MQNRCRRSPSINTESYTIIGKFTIGIYKYIYRNFLLIESIGFKKKKNWHRFDGQTHAVSSGWSLASREKCALYVDTL